MFEYYNHTTPEEDTTGDRIYISVIIGALSFILVIQMAAIVYLLVSKRNIRLAFKQYRQRKNGSNPTIPVSLIQYECDEEFGISDSTYDAAAKTNVTMSTFTNREQSTDRKRELADVPERNLEVISEKSRRLNRDNSVSRCRIQPYENDEYQELSIINLPTFLTEQLRKSADYNNGTDSDGIRNAQSGVRNAVPQQGKVNNEWNSLANPKSDNNLKFATFPSERVNRGKQSQSHTTLNNAPIVDVKEVYVSNVPIVPAVNKCKDEEDVCLNKFDKAQNRIRFEISKKWKQTEQLTEPAYQDVMKNNMPKDKSNAKRFQSENLYENVGMYSRVPDVVIDLGIHSDGEEYLV